jgi:hypothetical protein
MFHFLPPVVAWPTFVKVAETISHFDEASDFATAVSSFTHCLANLPDESHGQQVCDLAMGTFVALVQRFSVFLSIALSRADNLLDLRAVDQTCCIVVTPLVSLISSIWQICGDVSSVPWREHVPRDPTSPLSLGVWASYYRLIDPREDIVQLLCAGLSADAKDLNCLLQKELFESLRAVVALKQPLSVEAVSLITNSTIEWISSHPRQNLRGCASLLLAFVLWSYPEQADESTVIPIILQTVPFRWIDKADVSEIAHAVSFFATRFFSVIARAGEETLATVIRSLAWAADELGSDCPPEATALLMREDIRSFIPFRQPPPASST